ncbi:hypothetical protein [Collimonas humicola]|uniref:hypothetical protein n=1 Tax=Collimonas humicola TaxID=2825886 RepID=UPI001B8CBB75|nr:hypothetical protein [Collimonas humicola]
MASLRAQAFDKQYAKTGAISFKKSGRDAAYRGAARSTMKSTGSSSAAHRAGMAASKSAASQGGSM